MNSFFLLIHGSSYADSFFPVKKIICCLATFGLDVRKKNQRLHKVALRILLCSDRWIKLSTANMSAASSLLFVSWCCQYPDYILSNFRTSTVYWIIKDLERKRSLPNWDNIPAVRRAYFLAEIRNKHLSNTNLRTSYNIMQGLTK